MKSKKHWWIASAILIVLLIGGRFFAAHKAEQAIQKEFQKTAITYENSEIQLFPAKIALSKVVYEKDNQKGKAQSVAIQGISYWEYFINNTIHIDEIKVSQLYWQQNFTQNKKDNTKSVEVDSLQKIIVESFIVEEAQVLLTRSQDTVLKVEKANLNLTNTQTDAIQLQHPLPARWESCTFSFTTLFSHIDNIHSLSIASLAFEDKDFSIQNLQINPRYSRAAYIYQIPHEKDLATLKVPQIKGSHLLLGNSADALSCSLGQLAIQKPQLNLYRDKTVKDDPTHKNLYSKMLRKLPIFLHIDSISIADGYVSYEEKHKQERNPGKVTFAGLQAEIGKLYNHHPSGKIPDTKVHMKALVFDQSPVNVDWTFNVGSPQDAFQIKGSGHDFKGEAINSFLTPEFLLKTEGTVDKYYFNFSGNDESTLGDFHIYYDNFKLNILNKKKKELKIVSWIGNLFVKNKPKEDNAKAHVENVERDKTKSFWNYFWNCIKEGLIQALTVKDKKKKD